MFQSSRVYATAAATKLTWPARRKSESLERGWGWGCFAVGMPLVQAREEKLRFSLQEEFKVFILKTPTHIQVLASIYRLHTGVEIAKDDAFKRERLKNVKT